MQTRSRPKHIALVIRNLNGRSGGAERIYCELANILCDKGYRVTCLHFDGKQGRPFYRLDKRVERINLFGKAGIWTRRLVAVSAYLPKPIRERIQWSKDNGFFVQQLRYYFELVGPDVAISILPPANTPTLLAARDTEVKVIACNHNVPEEDYNNPRRWGKTSFDRRLRLQALDHAAAVHVLFPSFGEWFPAHLQDRVVAIPNYISSDFKRPDPGPEREKIVLAVGRLAEVKNYMQLITSWTSLATDFPDWKVRIFGIGPQHEEMKHAIEKLQLGGQIQLAGHISDLTMEYAKASIFCHPSLYEGFGLSAAESLFLETPVVIYADCAGVSEFVRDGYNGLAVQRYAANDHLADALRVLMADRDLRRSLGSNGPESVKQFTLKEYESRWVSLIESLGEA